MSDDRLPLADRVVDRATALRLAFDRSFAEARPPGPPPSEDLLAIRLGPEPYALRLSEIAGVFADRKISRLPSRAPALLGIAGFRGAILPVYDLHRLLDQSGCPPSETMRRLVIAADAPVAFAFSGLDGHRRLLREAIVQREPGRAELELEKHDSGAAQVQRLLRLAHTLKGAARVVKQPEIADRAHAIEGALSPFRDAASPVPSDRVDIVLAHLDDINGRVSVLTPAAQGTLVASAERPALDGDIRTVRAEIAEMDALLDGVLETHPLLDGLRATARSCEQTQRLADLVAEQLAPRGGARDNAAGGRRQNLCTG